MTKKQKEELKEYEAKIKNMSKDELIKEFKKESKEWMHTHTVNTLGIGGVFGIEFAIL